METNYVRGPVCCAGGIRGFGNIEQGIVIVGITPASKELELGRPLVGESGKILDYILAKNKWQRSLTYATNLCCTWIKEPTPDDILTCHERLARELTLCQPKLVVGLGGAVSQALFNMPFGRARGAILQPGCLSHIGLPQAYGLVTYHPAAILRASDNPDMQNDFAASLTRDLRKIGLFFGPATTSTGSTPRSALV